jgi:hypothetical protein
MAAPATTDKRKYPLIGKNFDGFLQVLAVTPDEPFPQKINFTKHVSKLSTLSLQISSYTMSIKRGDYPLRGDPFSNLPAFLKKEE